MLNPFLLIFLAALNSTIGNLLLKLSRETASSQSSSLAGYLSISFIGAVFFYGLNLVIFAKALDLLQLNIAYPILASLGFIMLIASSAYFFGESINFYQLIGLLLAIIGIFLMANN